MEKKIFTAPSVNFMEVEMEDNILGASAIVSGGQAQSGGEGGVAGGNGGDANARTNSNVAANPSKPSISAYELN